ncbi:MAG: hypothetical protein IJG17_01410 [Eubacterium sp.]|nr:hypothetical protein [Eubacterium sp.]MBQ9062442.1 hypothetical protein [Eubacterium sp.]
MSRAFVTEHDGWNYCLDRSRDCPDASLRGQCERISCRYGPKEETEKNKEVDHHVSDDR